MGSLNQDTSTHQDLAVCIYMSNYSCPHDFIDNYDYSTYKRCLEFQNHLMTYLEYQIKESAVFIFYGCILSIISILGILGNALSFWIMLTPEFSKSTTTIYLRVLMIMDSLYLATNFFHYSLITGLQLSQWLIDALPSYSRVYIYYVIIDLIRIGSALLVMAVTVERYILVCHSLRAQSMCTSTRAKIYVAGIIAIAIIYEAPRLFILQVKQYSVQGGNNASDCDPIYLVQPSTLISETMEIVINVSGTVAFYLIPMVVIVALTWRLLAAVKQSRIFRGTMAQGRRSSQDTQRQISSDRQTTIILLSVVIMFIVCNLPNTFIVIARLTNAWDDWNRTLPGSLTFYVAILLVNLNSAGNVVLFCFFGQKFRNAFVRIFFRCRCKLRQRNAYSHAMRTGYYSNTPATSQIEMTQSKFTSSNTSMLSTHTFKISETSCACDPKHQAPLTTQPH